jgi:hypothetical protein
MFGCCVWFGYSGQKSIQCVCGQSNLHSEFTFGKKKPLIHHLDNSCHLHTNGGNRTLRENFGRHLNSDLILVKPDGRYTIRRWRQIRETNMPKDRRAMKRLSALFTLPYCKIFI